jgi:hypothetical protein
MCICIFVSLNVCMRDCCRVCMFVSCVFVQLCVSVLVLACMWPKYNQKHAKIVLKSLLNLWKCDLGATCEQTCPRGTPKSNFHRFRSDFRTILACFWLYFGHIQASTSTETHNCTNTQLTNIQTRQQSRIQTFKDTKIQIHIQAFKTQRYKYTNTLTHKRTNAQKTSTRTHKHANKHAVTRTQKHTNIHA